MSVNQENLIDSAEKITGSCKTVASAVIQALGIKLNVPIPDNLNDLSKLFNNLFQPGPTHSYPPSCNITDLSDNSGVLHNVLSSVSQLVAECSSLKSNLQEFSNGTKKSISEVNASINNINQYDRIKSILIHNLPDVPRYAHGREFSTYAADKLNQMFPWLERKLTCEDISRSHILKTRKKLPIPVIVVQFINRDLRNMIYLSKKKLRKSQHFSNINITEHLTGMNKALVDKAREAKVFDSVWTFEGYIFGYIENKRMQISREDDIPKGPIRPKYHRQQSPNSYQPSNSSPRPNPNQQQNLNPQNEAIISTEPAAQNRFHQKLNPRNGQPYGQMNQVRHPNDSAPHHTSSNNTTGNINNNSNMNYNTNRNEQYSYQNQSSDSRYNYDFVDAPPPNSNSWADSPYTSFPVRQEPPKVFAPSAEEHFRSSPHDRTSLNSQHTNTWQPRGKRSFRGRGRGNSRNNANYSNNY